MRHRTILALVLALVAASCTSGSDSATTPSPGTPTSTPTQRPGLIIPMRATSFGTLQDVPLLGDSPPYAGPASPDSLDDVDVSSRLNELLTQPGVTESLERNGFVVVPGWNAFGQQGSTKLFFEVYTAIPYSPGGAPTTVYVTTDVAYHYWHLVYDKVLRTLEQDVFLPKLEQLSAAMLAEAGEQAADLKGTAMADAASRVFQLTQVEASLLALPAGTLGPLAERELDLIAQHADQVPSPVTGSRTDYGLYTPRGHYTRNAELTRYFLGMSLLGQAAFAFDPASTHAERVEAGRGALLGARLVSTLGVATAETQRLWRDLYDASAFLVGVSDDYTPREMIAAADTVRPGSVDDPGSLTDSEIATIVDTLTASRPVRIDPEHPTMRIMGVRFVLDSWIMDQLIYPNVGTADDPRLMPSGLDVASAFGSPAAARFQRQAGVTDFVHYGSQMHRMRRAVDAVSLPLWGSTVYNGWLWSLRPMWHPHGAAYPDYMRTPVWATKDLQTGLSSYAELKHDNLLYVKQAAAEGAGPGPEYVIRNWVEPDPVVFGRLSAIDALMLDGLDGRDLLSAEASGLLVDLAELYDFWARIATDELAGLPLSDADNQRLEETGTTLEALWARTSDIPVGSVGGGGNLTDDESAIIADIARGMDEVLEVGTGRIDTVLVIVPDDQGGFQLAVGAAYSYYEFPQPATDRLTDEAWRAMLDDGTAPERPAWEGAFLAGAP